MKPINLKMTAFEPFAKTIELDFEKGLDGENFFLIHGATGAGKTSILDAICYALYGSSSGGERNGKMMRSEQAAATVQTEVEFTFALGDKIYKIKRGLKFGNSDPTAEIYCNNLLLESGAVKVSKIVAEIIGFKIEQFRQVILLPQGSFKKFLTANSKERGEVLNTIFDANFYALIEKRLKEKSVDAEKLCKDLETQQKNLQNDAAEIGNIQDEKINLPALLEIFTENLSRSKNKIAALKVNLDKAVADLTAAEILNKEFENLDAAQKNLSKTQAALEKISADLKAAQAEYEKRKSEENLRDELKNKIAELTKIKIAFTELQAKYQELLKAQKEELAAQENLKKLERQQKKCEETLEGLKNQASKLQDADANFVKAAQKLKDAQEYETCKKEIARLKKEFGLSQKRFHIAQKNFDAAQKELKRLQLVQKMCTAAKLAKDLKDGEPCPVCGSMHHPNLAVTNEIIPTDEEIERAETFLNKKQIELDAAKRGITAIEEKINAQKNLLEKFVDVVEIKAAETFYNETKQATENLKICRERILKGETFTKNVVEKVKTARLDLENKTRTVEKLRGIVEEKRAQIPPAFLIDLNKISQDLRAAQTQKENLDAAWQAAEDIFHKSEKEFSECQGKVTAAQNSFNDAAKKIAGKTPPNIPDFKNKKILAQDNYTAAVTESAKLENNLNRLQDISKKLEILSADLNAANKDYQIWKKLSDVANGTISKITFQRYYLNSIFNEIIFEANERLERMSGGRYRFRNERNELSRQKLEGLNLEILDAYTGTARPVETLSGGESFLASLSLALGLAAVVKNTAGGIKLDTIFIDEGFGTLDNETLDIAMNALTDLQSGGRLVGIISHVDELKRRVPVRLEVVKTKTGSTAYFAR